MRPRDFNPDELKGIRSAPVPGFPNVRADEHGKVWKWDGGQWVRIGTGAGKRTSLRTEAGVKRAVKVCWLVCAAWHGKPQKGWSVAFRNGDRKNLKPWNLKWCEKQRPGMTRKLSNVQQEEIRERAEAGETLTSLAAEFKVSVATICNICKGYKRRGESVAARSWTTPEERAEIVRQRKAGSKGAAVAERFGRTATLVYRLAKEEREREKQACSQSERDK